MKKQLLNLIYLVLLTTNGFAQSSGSFVVQGDLNKFYPVLFTDASWYGNKATEFDLGRSDVHTDATISNGNRSIIIWLRGGSSTYYYNSQDNVSPTIYDGVQNALPYLETNGPARSYKTDVDSYLNSFGENIGGSAFFTGGTNNYFAGNVGIGTTTPDEKLTVNGTIHSTEVKVTTSVPAPDYVFESDYKLPSLEEIKAYTDKNHHLPEISSAKEIEKNGIS